MADGVYTPRPYVREAYTSQLRLGDLMRSRGRSRADAELRRGDASANLWANVGNTIAGTVGTIMQGREQEQREQRDAPFRAMQFENESLKNTALKAEAQATGTAQKIQASALEQDPETGVWSYNRDRVIADFTQAGIADRLPDVLESLDAFDESARGVQQMKAEGLAAAAYGVLRLGNSPQALKQAIELAVKNGFITRKDAGPILQQVGDDPAKIGELMTALASSSPKFAEKLGPKEPKLHNVAPGSSVIDANNPQAGPVFQAPPATPPQQPFNLSPGQTRFGPDNQPIASVPPTPPSRDPNSEPLVAVIGKDGKPVLVPRSQAVNMPPASSREQGRAVTSGDAGRFAELQTSLDDLKVLRSTLFPDADLNKGDVQTEKPTGTRAAIGAALPNWMTEITGWGADAKSRQAVIDRVKQVIGKSLEGGVLRKEDEIKYTKILPTIKDHPSVVKDKLDGLDRAIALRLQRDIDAREDAGYDVTKFRQRGAGGAAPAADPLGLFK